jgi:hypothetical protein
VGVIVLVDWFISNGSLWDARVDAKAVLSKAANDVHQVTWCRIHELCKNSGEEPYCSGAFRLGTDLRTVAATSQGKPSSEWMSVSTSIHSRSYATTATTEVSLEGCCL